MPSLSPTMTQARGQHMPGWAGRQATQRASRSSARRAGTHPTPSHARTATPLQGNIVAWVKKEGDQIAPGEPQAAATPGGAASWQAARWRGGASQAAHSPAVRSAAPPPPLTPPAQATSWRRWKRTRPPSSGRRRRRGTSLRSWRQRVGGRGSRQPAAGASGWVGAAVGSRQPAGGRTSQGGTAPPCIASSTAGCCWGRAMQAARTSQLARRWLCWWRSPGMWALLPATRQAQAVRAAGGRQARATGRACTGTHGHAGRPGMAAVAACLRPAHPQPARRRPGHGAPSTPSVLTTTTPRLRRPARPCPAAASAAPAAAAAAPAAAPKPSRGSGGSFPAHELMGMPALSPTMTQGNISAWVKKVGDSIAPGERRAAGWQEAGAGQQRLPAIRRAGGAAGRRWSVMPALCAWACCRRCAV